MIEHHTYVDRLNGGKGVIHFGDVRRRKVDSDAAPGRLPRVLQAQQR